MLHHTRRRFLAVGAPLLAGSTLNLRAATRAERPAVQPPPPWFLSRLPRLLEVSGTPGCAAVVLDRGRVVWEHYAGVVKAGDGGPVTRETMWPAASLGKPVFAVAALALVSDGKLDLDRPLRDYVADHAASDERTSRITARHVLSHTSGLPNWRTRDQPLVSDFEPGSRFSYSGEGYYYLQTVVERISGLGIEQVASRRVFEPLGMKSSTYAWREDVPGRLVAGHDRGIPRPSNIRDFSTKLLAYATAHGKPLDTYTSADAREAMGAIPDAPPPLPVFMVPNVAGSLITTPLDYAAFVAAMLEPSANPPGVTRPMRDMMTTPQISLNTALSWGLGWGMETRPDAPSVLWHWGDNGNWKNFVLIDRRDGSALVVFTNSSHGMNVAERFVAAATGEDHVAFQWL